MSATGVVCHVDLAGASALHGGGDGGGGSSGVPPPAHFTPLAGWMREASSSARFARSTRSSTSSRSRCYGCGAPTALPPLRARHRPRASLVQLWLRPPARPTARPPARLSLTARPSDAAEATLRAPRTTPPPPRSRALAVSQRSTVTSKRAALRGEATQLLGQRARRDEVKVVSEVCKHIGARLRRGPPCAADSNIQVNDGTRPFTATDAQHTSWRVGRGAQLRDPSGLDATDDAAAAGGADQSGRSVSMAAARQQSERSRAQGGRGGARRRLHPTRRLPRREPRVPVDAAVALADQVARGRRAPT